MKLTNMLLAAAIVLPGAAEAFERYQAVVIQEGPSPRVLIMDTREGHLWTWTETIRGSDQELRYQGRVRVGKRAGEVIQERNALNPRHSP
jgi:hypothetical protein